jgi:hypothetical protein
MTISGRKMRALGVAGVLALGLLAACVTPGIQGRAAAPARCTDSTYVQLTQQHPDSLSERSWQQLQSLGRECGIAQAYERDSSAGGSGHSGARDHGVGIGAGIMSVIMVAMMITML